MTRIVLRKQILRSWVDTFVLVNCGQSHYVANSLLLNIIKVTLACLFTLLRTETTEKTIMCILQGPLSEIGRTKNIQKLSYLIVSFLRSTSRKYL